MKLFKSLAVAGVGVFCLTSCNNYPVRHDEKDYYIDMTWNQSKPFRILQLTDLHISNMSDNDKHFKFIKKTVESANHPDLIIITGDLFTFANKSDAIETFDFFDSLGIPWAPTWGNHDEQNYFSVTWLTSELNKRYNSKSSHCKFIDLQNDDVFGNANYVINLKNGNTIVEQLFIFDSNRYNYGEYFGYDYIHHDQIDWYERVIHSNETIEGMEIKRKPSLAFFHIPFEEFEKGYQAALKDNSLFIKDDIGVRDRHEVSTGAPKINTDLFKKMKALESTKGVFIGHNHESSYMVKYDGIKLCCGIKSTNKVYCDETFLGGQVIELKTDGSGDFDVKRIITSYKDI